MFWSSKHVQDLIKECDYSGTGQHIWSKWEDPQSKTVSCSFDEAVEYWQIAKCKECNKIKSNTFKRVAIK